MSCSSCGHNTCNCIGLQGPQGVQGIQGETGATGSPGPQGIQGVQGPAGTNGTDGADGLGYGGSSSTNTNILDTGATTLSATMTVGLAYQSGARIRFSDTAAPSTNYFEGVINTYDSGTGAVDIVDINVKNGTGTINSWNVNIAGELGDQGATGATGLQGPQGLTGPTGATGATGAIGADGFGYDSLSATSTDILDTAATTVTMTIATDKAYQIGSRVRFADQASPTVNYFEGVVTSYSTATGVMDVGSVNVKSGTGTIADWGVSIAGEKGDTGAFNVVLNPSTPYDASNLDIVVWDASAGNKTVRLPVAASSANYRIEVKKTDASANTITIDPNLSETIEGGTTAILTTQYESITFVCDGTEWWIVAGI